MSIAFDAQPAASRPAPREIVFIMSGILDMNLFTPPDGAQVVLLDPSTDGLAQIAAALAGLGAVSAVHIIGHGAEGVAHIGTTELSADTLQQHQAALDAIKASLAPGADILLYGCSVGAGEAGTALLGSLAQATGADIAASTDATGSAQLGGNWVLERATGSIEAASLVLAGFSGLLAEPPDQDFELLNGSGGFGTSSVTLDGVIYRVDPTDGINSPSLVVDAAYLTNLHVASGQTIYMNSGGSANIQWCEFSASNLTNNFRLASMTIEDTGMGGTQQFTITGYDGGSATTPVATASINLALSSTGSINYTKSPSYIGGTLVFGTAWQNVDTIRFTSADGISIQVALDDINFEAPVGATPGITSATYDASTGVLSVTGTNMTAGATVAVSKLTLTGQGGATYALTSPDVTAASATSFSVTLNAADRLVANRLFSKNGVAALDTGAYNIAGASGWTSSAGADATNAITVSNVAAPAITSATYDGSNGTLVVTGTRFASKSGAANDIDPTKFTFTGEGGATYTLTSSTAVEFTSDTSFTLSLAPADKAALRSLLNKNGVTSSGATTYNLAAADGWAPGSAITHADLTGNGITVSNITRPTLSSVTLSKNTFKIGDTATVTFTFSEAVSGFTAADVTVPSGAIGTPTTSDGGTTWTATFTPAATTTDATNTISVDLTGVINASGYAGTGSASSSNYIVDTVRPTATIAISDTTLTIGETATVTITFSEAVTSFTNGDLTVPNGTLSPVSSGDGGITWTATLTPTASVADATNVIMLDNTGVIDARDNPGTGVTTSPNYSVQTVRPTATIALADSALSAGETSLVTITFSEAVTGFTNADLSVANGTLSAVSSADGGVTWTATFTPAAGISDNTNVITLDNTGVTNGAGNSGSGTTSSGNYAIDNVRPTATIALSDSALKMGETATVTITFSEAVTGFDNTDLTVEGGSLSAVSSADGGITWTATFTPTTPLEDASNTIALNQAGVADAAGNTGTGTATSANYAVDTLRPAATSVTLGSSALKAGDTTTVTILFPEAVTGFTTADLTVGSGAVSGLSSADGGITWTGTFTPSANTSAATNVISVDNTTVTDLAGNAGAGTTSSANYTVQTTRPTASIAIADASLKAGETSLVTFTFSEAVSGFTSADVTVQNGTLGAPSSSDGGITWTATFTPAADITDATNVITLDNTGVVNGAGNSGTGTTTSANYQVDTARPTATIAMADSALAIGETSLITITFSEAVSGFTNADLTVENGTLSAVASADGGVTWTATFTPDASVSDTTNMITLDNTGVVDAAGNAGTGTSTSANYTIDSQRPTATVELLDNALTAGETTTLKVTFSEAVTGFTSADLTVANGTIGPVSSSDGGITWTASFTPTANISDTTNVATLNLAGVADGAGNAGSGTVDSANYTVQTTRPTATIAIADVHLKAGETSLVTFTFSEAVSGFTSADVIVQNGTLDAPSSSDGGITWTANYTPAVDITDATNVITLDNTGVVNGAGNSGTGTTTSANYQVDTARPTATIAMADSALAIGETSLVTITFSEAVSGFTNADLTVENGTLGAVASADGGVTWTATFTPAASVSDTTNVITLDNTGVVDGFGNAGTGTTASANYSIDSQRPTATVELLDTALTAGETTTLKVTFSEAVTGFTSADLTVANGTIGAVSSSDGGVTWTASFTPTANISDTTNVATLNLAGVADAAGNAGSGTVDSANYTVQTTRPTATIAIADAHLKAGETSLVTFTFSEAVTGFTGADVTVENGTLGAPSSSDGGITWTATFTPAADITDTTNLITLDNTGVMNAAGNAGSGTTVSANYQVDTARPTATIVVADTALASGETSLVTITFSEAVTGLTTADFTVENGTIDTLATSDNISWTATLHPSASITDTSNVITLDNTGVQDTAGNTGMGTTASNNYAVDSLRPTATVELLDTALTAGEATTLKVTFSEAVTGFTNADLAVANGTLGPVSSGDGGVTWTATFTPAANTTDLSNVVTLNLAGVADAAGNAGSGTADSPNYTVQTVRPTATIAMTDDHLKAGESSLVTFTFSEAVSGFTGADVTVQNGTLGAPSSSDGGVTWTATFTPAADITDTTNVITLDNTGVANGAGNAGSGTTVSANYQVDTARPTATIAMADNALAAGETSLVTITFSEAVTGFTNADLTVDNGTLGAVSSADGGITWTATFTPAANVADSTNVITLDNTGVQDAAGNTGAGATTSANYAIDSQRPSATIAVAGDTLGLGGSTTVTITFSEPVSGFTDADLTVQNGTIEGLASADGGKTWTATLRPAAGTGAASNVITLDNTGVADLAGNAGTGTSTSNSYAVRTDVPTATIVVSDSALTGSETSLVTITFSHAVTGFTNDDLTVENGSLSAVTSSDGGKTWTATLTPASSVEDTSNVITLDNSGVATLAGTPGAGTSGSNNYTVDTKGPSATVTLAASTITNGTSTTVTIRFSEAVAGFGIDDISVGSGALTELASADGGITWTAKLTASAVAATNAVRVNLAGLADLAGNSGAGNAVSANYVVEAPEKPAGGTVDGVPVTQQTGTDPATGLSVNKITVPVITPTRVEDPSTPNSGLADIPLGSGSGGAGVQLSVGLPIGVGLQAEGPSAPLSGAQGLLDLIHRIESHTTPGTPVQQEMKGDGSNFLQSLAPQTQLETRTIVLTAPGNTASSIAITGAPAQPNAAVALVIDTTALAAGSVLQLNDVEFAAIVGNATLRGGAGRNYVTGDGASQSIFLGADDDELHGGAGDDIVGSEAGDDLVDGGDGKDIVVGGAGNDRLFGGTGNDILAGGRSDVGQWKFNVDAAGHVSASHEMALFYPGQWETVAQSQLDASANGLRFLQASGSKLVDLALFYKAAFGRAGDLSGLEFWAGYQGSATQMMAHFMQSAEYQLTQYAGLDDAGFVGAVYTNLLGRAADADGLAFWTGKLGASVNPMSRAELLTHFALSAEHRTHAEVGGLFALGEGKVTQQSQWFAGSGNDRIDGGAGSDSISGGDGIDTVVYGGQLKQYRFELAKDGAVHIRDTASGDVDTISGIERGEFGSQTIDLSFTQAKPAALQALGMLYQVLFDRAADIAGLNWWLGLGDQTPQLVQWMLGTDEFKSRYTGATDAAFAKALFDNAGLRADQAGGLSYWENYLHGHSRAEMVAALIGQADVIGAQFGADGLWLV